MRISSPILPRILAASIAGGLSRTPKAREILGHAHNRARWRLLGRAISGVALAGIWGTSARADQPTPFPVVVAVTISVLPAATPLADPPKALELPVRSDEVPDRQHLAKALQWFQGTVFDREGGSWCSEGPAGGFRVEVRPHCLGPDVDRFSFRVSATSRTVTKSLSGDVASDHTMIRGMEVAGRRVDFFISARLLPVPAAGSSSPTTSDMPGTMPATGQHF